MDPRGYRSRTAKLESEGSHQYKVECQLLYYQFSPKEGIQYGLIVGRTYKLNPGSRGIQCLSSLTSSLMAERRASPVKVLITINELNAILVKQRMPHGQCHTLGTGVHALHVHVWPEQCHFTVGADVCLHSFENRLSVV